MMTTFSLLRGFYGKSSGRPSIERTVYILFIWTTIFMLHFKDCSGLQSSYSVRNSLSVGPLLRNIRAISRNIGKVLSEVINIPFPAEVMYNYNGFSAANVYNFESIERTSQETSDYKLSEKSAKDVLNTKTAATSPFFLAKRVSTDAIVFGENQTSVYANVLKGKGKPVLAARLVTWILCKVVEARSSFLSGLSITVLSHSNRDIFRGRVSALELKFDKIAFGQLWVTGGGRLLIEGLDLQMRKFLFQDMQSLRKPYSIYGDFILTQSDIINSKIIRDWIQLLVDTILRRIPVLAQASGMLQVAIKRVTIRARRLFVYGEAQLSSAGAMLPFEVSLGAGVTENGHVIYIKNIEVVLNPDSAILRTVVPIILTSPIDIDIGDDCKLDSFVIANKHVWIRARSNISPVSPFAVAPEISRALYYYNLGAILSSILRPRGGIIRWRPAWLSRWLESMDDSIPVDEQ